MIHVCTRIGAYKSFDKRPLDLKNICVNSETLHDHPNILNVFHLYWILVVISSVIYKKEWHMLNFKCNCIFLEN